MNVFNDTNSRVRDTMERAGNAVKKKYNRNIRKIIGIWMVMQMFSCRPRLVNPNHMSGIISTFRH